MIPGTPDTDLHGMSVDEARDAVERAIQSAFMDREELVRVIHGKGEGRLRDAVRQLLSSHKLVERHEDDAAAGSLGGATLIWIARR